MEIQLLTPDHPLWQKTVSFAENCAWKAGPFLARRMKENGFLPWERVLAACEGEEIVGFCTLSQKDELPENLPYAPFIGFVFVEERYRGRRISEKMIDRAARYAKTLGYRCVYIMSSEQGLYEKYGFRKIGDFETIYGTTDQLFEKELSFQKANREAAHPASARRFSRRYA